MAKYTCNCKEQNDVTAIVKKISKVKDKYHVLLFIFNVSPNIEYQTIVIDSSQKKYFEVGKKMNCQIG